MPRVSIGMPVFNGEQHLEEAIRSVLAQTFEDFELVISDNASTDRTGEIARTFQEKDERIRYVRNESNVGFVNNFNAVFNLSEGDYFKWWSSDDLCDPTYIERCVEVLDSDPGVVLAFSIPVGIDETGNRLPYLPGQITDRDTPGTVGSTDPVERFRKLVRHIWWVDAAFYGLMRAEVLRKTSLHRAQRSGDQLLVTEMAMHGRLHEIPEELFFSRYHVNKTSAKQKTHRQRAELIENRKLGRDFRSLWRIVRGHPMRLAAYAGFVNAADLSLMQKAKCYYEIVRSLGWWSRLRIYGFLRRWRDIDWLRPSYPPRPVGSSKESG